MKSKQFIIVLCMAILMAACRNSSEGFYTGSNFGYLLGAAIGGIAGRGLGHDIGAAIGTVGGAAAGAAIGNAKEKARTKERRETLERLRRVSEKNRHLINPVEGNDDRVDLGLISPGEPPLEIRHATITETKQDGLLTRGEQCTVTFEIYNVSDQTLNDIRPMVKELTDNDHVKISPDLLIESIGPRQGVRYTATILADKKLKDGEIKVKVGVACGEQEVESQMRCFTISTAKGAK